MTQRQFCKRVAYWLKHPQLRHLGIAHWHVDFYFEDDIEGSPASVASVECNRDYDHVEFTATNGLLEHGDEVTIDYVIVHELIHVVMRDLDIAVNDMLETMSVAEAGAYALRLRHDRERLVDRIARSICALTYAAE